MKSFEIDHWHADNAKVPKSAFRVVGRKYKKLY